MTDKGKPQLLRELSRLNDEADQALEEWLGSFNEVIGKRLDKLNARRIEIMRELN
jgi:hypothetical protein